MVKNDNPYIESFFKTLKYHAAYPGTFKTIDDARSWMGDFIDWYNTTHRHSGLGYITPEQRRTGEDINLFARRNETMRKAFEQYPERFSKNGPKVWSGQRPRAYLTRGFGVRWDRDAAAYAEPLGGDSFRVIVVDDDLFGLAALHQIARAGPLVEGSEESLEELFVAKVVAGVAYVGEDEFAMVDHSKLRQFASLRTAPVNYQHHFPAGVVCPHVCDSNAR